MSRTEKVLTVTAVGVVVVFTFLMSMAIIAITRGTL